MTTSVRRVQHRLRSEATVQRPERDDDLIGQMCCGEDGKASSLKVERRSGRHTCALTSGTAIAMWGEGERVAVAVYASSETGISINPATALPVDVLKLG
jgi:hypothetical protein